MSEEKQHEEPIVENDAQEEEVQEEQLSKEQEYLQGWKRALADYENLKKNIASEKQGERKRLKISLAHDLLPVIDNFEQAVAHVPEMSAEEQKKFENWLTGVTFIKKQFEDVLSGLGIEPVAIGEEFDPNLHEASAQESDETKADGAILRTVQSGWKMEDMVIRPAKVIINKLEETQN